MTKTRIAQLAGIAAAIPMLMLTTTTSASAASGYDIGWKQRATDHCLMWVQNDDNTYKAQTDAACWPSASQGTGWDDIQQSNGYYTEQIKNLPLCLDEGNVAANGTAPVTPWTCYNDDWNQQWDEQWDANAKSFRLVNHDSGRCLDADGAGDLYTLPCQSGNNYQLWY